MGSKRKIAKDLIRHIVSDVGIDNMKGRTWVEPFVGGCNMLNVVTPNLVKDYICNDGNYYLIELFKKLLSPEGFNFPDEVSEAEYKHIRENKDTYDPALVGFVGFNLTFGSKWFGGYSHNSEKRNFALAGKNNLTKQIEILKNRKITWYNKHYIDLTQHIPDGSIVYCDPPYNVDIYNQDSCTQYTGAGSGLIKFYFPLFLSWVENIKKHKGCIVYYSNYFNKDIKHDVIWSRDLTINIDNKNNRTKTEKECLFKV